MAYHRKHQYKSRHERYAVIKRKTKVILLFFFIALLILIYRNWLHIVDTLRLYF